VKKFSAGLLIATLVSACASYDSRVLDPWVGAGKAELVAAWGYPQSANDLVRIDDRVTVYTYRNPGTSAMTGQPSTCAVSFSIEADRVTSARRVGTECRAVVRR